MFVKKPKFELIMAEILKRGLLGDYVFTPFNLCRDLVNRVPDIENKKIPIVVTTVHDEVEIVKKFIVKGIMGYILKTGNITDLTIRLREIVETVRAKLESRK